jgi:hypothetical protein
MSSGRFLASSNNTPTAPGYSWVNATSTGMFMPASNQIAFVTQGVEALRISSNGNVGISTSNPMYTLDINGSINATQFLVAGNDMANPGGLSNNVNAVSNVAFYASNVLSNYLPLAGGSINGNLTVAGNVNFGNSGLRIVTMSNALVGGSDSSNVAVNYEFLGNLIGNIKMFTLSNNSTSYYADYDVSYTASNAPVVMQKTLQNSNSDVSSDWYYSAANSTLTLSTRRSQASNSYTLYYAMTAAYTNLTVSKSSTVPTGSIFTGYSVSLFNSNMGIGKIASNAALDVLGTLNATLIQQGGIALSNLYLPSSTSNQIIAASNAAFFSSNAVNNCVPLTGGTITGNLTVGGNLTVSGTTTTINTENVLIRDNIITLNAGQTGVPASTLWSGIEVSRGSNSNFYAVFDESNDLFKVGLSNSLQAVLTRNDALQSGYLYFDSNQQKTINRDITIADVSNLTSNIVFSSNAASTASNVATWSSNNMLQLTGGTLTGVLGLASGATIAASSNHTASNPSYSWQGNTTTGIYLQSNNQIGISVAGSNRMVIGSNVGINTLSPSCIFEVNMGNSNSSAMLTSSLGGLTNGTVNGGALYFGPPLTQGSNALIGGIEASWNSNNGTPTVSVGLTRDAVGCKISTIYPNNIACYTSNVERMTITDNGNIGIGTIAPAFTLDVAGAARFGTSNALGPVLFSNGRVDDVDVSVLNKRVRASRSEASNASFQWIQRQYANTNNLTSLVWSSELGIFVAVASAGTNRVATSGDGINWTPQTAATPNEWRSVCWSPELSIFCAVGSSAGSNNNVMTSSNGTSWISRTTPSSDTTYYDVCWSSERGIFVSVSVSGSNRVMTSPSGVTWTDVNVGSGNSWGNIAWSPELSLFVAISGGPSSGPSNIYSSNGSNWSISSLPNPGAAWADLKWIPELSFFYAVAHTGGCRGALSYDGINWTNLTTNLTSVANNRMRTVCWSPQLSSLVISYQDSNVNGFLVSSDGFNFKNIPINDGVQPSRMEWSPELSMFVATTNSSYLWTSVPVLPASKSTLLVNPAYMTVTSNGNVGVGTSNPSAKLHVAGNALASSFGSTSDGTSSAPSYTWSNDTDTGIYHPGDNQFAISTGGTTRVFVNSNGYVGINNTNPISTLDVTGDIFARNGGSNLNAGAQLSFFATQSSSSNAMVAIKASLRSINAAASNETGDLLFLTRASNASNTTEQVRVTSTGLMGIGTSNPLERLHINGNAMATSFIASSGGSSNAPSFTWSSNSNTGMYQPNSNQIAFTTGGCNCMLLNSNSFVGIGTMTPWLPLTIQTLAEVKINPDAYNTVMLWDNQATTTSFNGVLAGGAVRNTASNYIELTPATSNQLGFATWAINPGNAWNLAFEYFSGGGGTGADGLFVNLFSSTTNTSNGNGYSLFLDENNSGGTDRVVVSYAGSNVTTWDLGVSGYLDNAAWKRVDVQFVRGTFVISLGNGLYSRVVTDIERANMFQSDTFFYMAGKTTATGANAHRVRNIRMSKYADGPWVATSSNLSYTLGNVGIGVSAPAFRLHVGGDTRISNVLYVGTDKLTSNLGTEGGKVVLGNTGSNAAGVDNNVIVSRIYQNNTEKSELLIYKGSTTQDRIRLRAAGIFFDTYPSNLGSSAVSNYSAENIRMTITNTGSVGIGTSNPGALLHVAGDTWANTFLALSNGTAASPAYSWSNNPTTGIFLNGSNQMGFSTNGIFRMAINSNGFVGVQTSNPVSALHVSGEARADTFVLARITSNNTEAQTRSNVTSFITKTNVSVNAAGTAGGSNLFGEHLTIENATLTGVYWGGNPSVYGGNIILKAGSVDLSGNNGSAWVNGYGGSLKFYPGYAYVGSNGSVQGGRTEFYYANTNGTSIDKSYTLGIVVANNGFVGVGLSNPSSRLHVNGTVTGQNFIVSSNGTPAAPAITWSTDSDTGLFCPDSNQFAISTAGSNRFFINSNGNIGINTSNPTGRLTINEAWTENRHIVMSGGSTPESFFGFGVNSNVLRYQVDSSSAAHVFFAGSNQLMRIQGDGRVAIGTSNPLADTVLHTNVGNGLSNMIAFSTSNGAPGFWYMGLEPTNNFVVYRNNNSNVQGQYLTASNPSAWTSFSDARLKQDIVPLDAALSNVLSLNPVRYKWKDTQRDAIGFVAQQVMQSIPDVVDTPVNPESYYGIRMTDIIPFLVKAIQDQQHIIDRQDEQIAHIRSLQQINT